MIFMKKVIAIMAISVALYACGGSSNETTATSSEATTTTTESTETTTGNPDYDPNRGEGKFSADNLTISPTVDAAMATEGESISGVKCSSCHKMTDERLVGPGWKGVTERRTSHWIMNFITNPDPMIDKDPALQAQLELCLVRMPNQSLVDEEARNILEFMRKNDGIK